VRLATARDPDVPLGMTLEALQARVAASRMVSPTERLWDPPVAPPSSKPPVRTMQFNMLARGLSSAPGRQLYPHTMESTYGDFDTGPDADQVFDWEHRKWRVLDQILQVDPDLLAMEELDQIDFIQPALEVAGYDGVYQPKRDSPCLMFGFCSDGTGLFWKRDKFRLQTNRSGLMPAAAGDPYPRHPYQLVDLLHRPSGASITVAAVHLKAKPTQACEDQRRAGIDYVLSRLEADNAGAILLMGDFNAGPWDTPAVVARCVPAVLASPLGLSSAYPIAGSEAEAAARGEWTTWKTRHGLTIRRTIDYIFATPSLRCLRVLRPPSLDAIGPKGLPNLDLPSDHLCIAAEFEVFPQGPGPNPSP